METKIISSCPEDAIECGLGYDSIPYMFDTSKNIQHVIDLPLWDDDLADAFYEAIEDAFYSQGAYMRKCDYCGKPYPYFSHGLRFNHCSRGACLEKACRKAEECLEAVNEHRRQKEAEKEQRASEKTKKEKPTPAPQAPRHAGVIYLMRAENGLHKIGRSKDIKNRLSGLNREIPIKIEVIHTIQTNDTLKSEKVMHERYKDQRVRYEWFNLSPAQVEEILSIPPFGIDQ